MRVCLLGHHTSKRISQRVFFFLFVSFFFFLYGGGREKGGKRERKMERVKRERANTREV
jgi:hypothetical protein